MDFKDILNNFQIEGEVNSVKKFGAGHINETYLIETSLNKYILQSLNIKVFKDYVGVMNNIDKVTSFLKQKYEKEGRDIDHLLFLIKTKDNNHYLLRDGQCFRMMNYIDNSIVLQQTKDVHILEQAGIGLGGFIKDLEDFNTDQLVEVIPNFHNTKIRFNDFLETIEADKAYRVKSVQKEIDFVLARKDIVSIIVDGIENKTIPIRVTHNDTKLNNFMFDKDTHDYMCLVDLDTIMPGSLLYDFGDAIRIGCSTAGEEERDLDKVHFDLTSYEAFLKGFIKGIGNSITKYEAELLHISAKIMTFEIGMRFLKDYLDGDVYFKIQEEDSNLVRARTQLKMVQELERKTKDMEKILYKYYNKE